MPSLSDTLINQIPEGLSPVVSKPPEQQATQPSVLNTFMRCPLPPIFASNPDSVRQFYVDGRVPQIRIYAQSLLKGS